MVLLGGTHIHHVLLQVRTNSWSTMKKIWCVPNYFNLSSTWLFSFYKIVLGGLVFTNVGAKVGHVLPPDEEVAACSCLDSMNSWHFWIPKQLCMFFLAFPDKFSPKSQCTWGPLWNECLKQHLNFSGEFPPLGDKNK